MKMGLDMYAFATKESFPGAVDFPDPESVERIHYWRKHPNLHGWMKQLYRGKGGKDKSFNCVNLQLTVDDLQQLETDIRAMRLPKTEGFFFGLSDGSEIEDDLNFVDKAKAALNANCSVFYSSWW
jgi:hypothetical protein